MILFCWKLYQNQVTICGNYSPKYFSFINYTTTEYQITDNIGIGFQISYNTSKDLGSHLELMTKMKTNIFSLLISTHNVLCNLFVHCTLQPKCFRFIKDTKKKDTHFCGIVC